MAVKLPYPKKSNSCHILHRQAVASIIIFHNAEEDFGPIKPTAVKLKSHVQNINYAQKDGYEL